MHAIPRASTVLISLAALLGACSTGFVDSTYSPDGGAGESAGDLADSSEASDAPADGPGSTDQPSTDRDETPVPPEFDPNPDTDPRDDDPADTAPNPWSDVGSFTYDASFPFDAWDESAVSWDAASGPFSPEVSVTIGNLDADWSDFAANPDNFCVASLYADGPIYSADWTLDEDLVFGFDLDLDDAYVHDDCDDLGPDALLDLLDLIAIGEFSIGVGGTLDATLSDAVADSDAELGAAALGAYFETNLAGMPSFDGDVFAYGFAVNDDGTDLAYDANDNAVLLGQDEAVVDGVLNSGWYIVQPLTVFTF